MLTGDSTQSSLVMMSRIPPQSYIGCVMHCVTPNDDSSSTARMVAGSVGQL